jgi:ADP-heptose:LPS heptosyltransferase
MSKILIIRFSAIGDVAMTVPVVYSAAKAFPEDSFTVLTQTFLRPLFMNCPANVSVRGADIRGAEKSFFKFLRYAFALKKQGYDAALDLHGVIRSRITGILFRLSGIPVFTIDKGRRERRMLTRHLRGEICRLRPVVDRYADVFHAAGFDFAITFVSLFDGQSVGEASACAAVGDRKEYRVGIAPFAGHGEKVYPPEKMEKVVEALSREMNITLFLFGGRGEEEAVLRRWENTYENTRNVAGRYPLEEELVLMSRLDVLVSMDSANMHLASLAGTKVISVWGATHPYAGFYGYGQREEYAVQVEGLPCRPCSIFGNRTCRRGDRACMNGIDPERIIHKVTDCLKQI